MSEFSLPQSGAHEATQNRSNAKLAGTEKFIAVTRKAHSGAITTDRENAPSTFCRTCAKPYRRKLNAIKYIAVGARKMGAEGIFDYYLVVVLDRSRKPRAHKKSAGVTSALTDKHLVECLSA